MPNFQLGKIYKIISAQTTGVYIGSTTQSLNDRLNNHKADYKRYPNKEFSSFNIIKYNDAQIILIENYPCNTKQELFTREQYYIDTMDCINKKNSISTREQKLQYFKDLKKTPKRKQQIRKYRENNKEKIKKQRHVKYEANQEKIKEKRKEHYENNKEKIILKAKEYYDSNKEKVKQYREDNKETRKQKAHEWYEKNKDKNREANNEKTRRYREQNREKYNENRKKKYYENKNESKIEDVIEE